ncbi:MAG: PH domain-containing protein [Actinomycetes bacterium]
MAYPHRLLGEGERIEHELHPHWKELVFPVLLVPLVAGVASFLYFSVPDWQLRTAVRWAIVVLAVLLLLFGSLRPYLRWRTTLYVLTSDRIITRYGVLSRAGRDIPLSRVNDVSFAHNLFERFLRCGTLTVESAGERGQLVLRDVPHVESVQRELYRLVDQHLAAHGISRDSDGTGDVPASQS